MDPKQAIRDGLDIYRREMRDFLNRTLQSKHPKKEGWVRAWASQMKHQPTRERIERALDRGELPIHLLDVGDFQHVIADYRDLFLEPFRPGQHHHSRLSEIAQMRNLYFGHDRGIPDRADAEKCLSMCAEVLGLAGLESAAEAVRDLITQMNPQQDIGNG